MRCEVPGCDREAHYDSPGDWCSEHWLMWWEWPEDEPGPKWFKEEEG